MSNSSDANDTPTPRARLLEKLNRVDHESCLVLEQLVDAMTADVREHISPDTDIVVPAFANHFRTRLQLHHATTREKFKKKAFEYAFQEASRAASRHARITVDGTHPGHDVTVDGLRFSLKTEASASICDGQITISKLQEARWIRECRTREDFRRGCERIVEHLQNYDRVLTLRGFSVQEPFDGVRYDFVEIPHDMLISVAQLAAEDFSPRTANGSSSADVYYDGGFAYKLRLDGSVEKVTITRLPSASCRLHARWTVPLLVPEQDD